MSTAAGASGGGDHAPDHNAYTEIAGSTMDGATGINPVPLTPEVKVVSYQNQMGEGRDRVDSVGSYGSGGSDEALLSPSGRSRGAVAGRHNATRPLLPKRRRDNQYHEIEEDEQLNINVTG